MTVKLLDYKGNATNVEVGDINNIGAMRIKVLSGDEVLTVIHKDDYSISEFDSCVCRINDYFDEEYEVYNVVTGVNLFEDKAFMERTNSYWMWW